MKHGKPETTAEVAVTGRSRELDLSARDREMLRFTDEHLNPPPKTTPLRLPDKHS